MEKPRRTAGRGVASEEAVEREVVEIARVTSEVPLLESTVDGGEKVAAAPVGNPETENPMEFPNVPFVGVSVKLKFAVFPADTVWLEVAAAIL